MIDNLELKSDLCEATSPLSEDHSSLDSLSAIDIADILLLTLARRRLAAITIESTGSRHVICCEQGGMSRTLTSLSPELGDAVVMRLTILANIRLSAKLEQIGHLRIRWDQDTSSSPPKSAEILVAVRPTLQGLGAELRRMVGSEEAIETGKPELPEVKGAEECWRVGPYRILSELGRGSMGIVYQAEHVGLQKLVALKVLHPGLAGPEAAARLIIEARAACRARHPGIVDVTDVGLLPGHSAYLVMELVEDPTLEAVLQHGPLDPTRALLIVANIANALRAANHHGVVHRDLKPANIFVGTGDRVKICDFGLARLIDPRTSMDSPQSLGEDIAGTVSYMAPEQARGEGPDIRSDLYSLGCVLFEMLTGDVPFSGETQIEVIEQQLTAPVPPVLVDGKPVPSAVERVVQRAMAKRIKERYQNTEEMLGDIDRAAQVMARHGWRRWLPT